MEDFKSELHYYLREKLWHSAITLCTEELSKGRNSYVNFWRSFAHSQEGSLIEAIRDAESWGLDPYFKYSGTIALITYYNMYSQPDESKINKLIERQIDYENDTTPVDMVNTMRFYCYLNESEKFNDMMDKLNALDTAEIEEELIVKGWKYVLESTPESWKRGQSFFEKYIKSYGNDNIDAIFGGWKCWERLKSYEEVLDTYQEVIKWNNAFFPWHLERIKIYLWKNDYDTASDYISSRWSSQKHFEINRILAVCNWIQDGDYKSAKFNLEKMWDWWQKNEPKNPEWYYSTAWLFARICDKNNEILGIVEEMIDKAIEFNPNNAKYLILKAYIRWYHGEINKAIELFSKSTELDTNNRDSSLGLIYCKILQNRFREAQDDIKFMKDMMIDGPKSHKLILFESMAMFNLGEREEDVLLSIKEALKAYIEYNKQATPWNKYEAITITEYDCLYDMAKVLLDYYSFDTKISLNNIPDTLKQSQRILALLRKNKYFISAHLLNSKLMFILSDNTAAFNTVTEVLTVNNKNLEALMLKALWCIEMKDFYKAKEVINDAMIENWHETKENSSFLIWKSKCELGWNDFDNSQKSLNQAIAVFDKNLADYNPTKNSLFKIKKVDKLELMKLNIDIWLKLGKTEEAQAFMNTLVIEFQDWGDELLMLHSELALKTGDIKKSVNLLKKIGEKDEAMFKKSRIKLSFIYLNHVMNRRYYAWCYNEILEVYPTFDNLKLAANAWMDIDSPDEALDYYKRALQIKNDMEVMRNLGRALIKTHDYKEAIEYYMQTSKIDERAINNQTVVNYWEMCLDFIEWMYWWSNNNNNNPDIPAWMAKKKSWKSQNEDYIDKWHIQMQKYDDYRLKDIYAKLKFVSAKIWKDMYIHDNTSIDKKLIFKTLEDALKMEKEVLVRWRELKVSAQINESKSLLCEIWYEISVYYTQMELNIDYCEKTWTEAVKNDSTHIDALYAISNLHMKKGNYNEAQRYIDMLLQEDESNQEALALLISVWNAKKSNESSITYLETTIAKQPNSYHLIELYIEIFRRSGTWTNAKDILYKSERNIKYTYTPGLYYCKGLFYKHMGEINKSLIEFSKAKTDEQYGIKCLEQMWEIYINPDCDILLISLDIPWNKKGDKGLLTYNVDGLDIEAIKFLLREWKTRRNDEKTWVYETYVAILTKDMNWINEKCIMLQDVLNKNKEDLSAWIALIMANWVMKKISEAKSHLKIMEKITWNIKFYTDYERGYLILAYWMMMSDNMKKAEEYLRKVLMLNVAQIKAYEYLAMIKDKEGMFQESCAYYEKAWEYSNKNNANIGYKYAISWINSKQHVKALNICNDIKRKFKDYPIDELATQAKKWIKSLDRWLSGSELFLNN